MGAAIRTILIADLVMSIDNVIAVAAAASRAPEAYRLILLIIGLATSIPLIIIGSTLLMKIMERFPIIITLGAALLGWLAGEMFVTDPAIAAWFKANLPHARSHPRHRRALLVVVVGKWLHHRARAPRPMRRCTIRRVERSPAALRADDDARVPLRLGHRPGAQQQRGLGRHRRGHRAGGAGRRHGRLQRRRSRQRDVHLVHQDRARPLARRRRRIGDRHRRAAARWTSASTTPTGDLQRRQLEPPVRRHGARRSSSASSARTGSCSATSATRAAIGSARAGWCRSRTIIRSCRSRSTPGLITAEQAAFSSNKNLVTRAVGVEDTVLLETHLHDVMPGDLYLLCSDGLST
jgi:hypothetical protein